MHSYGQTLWIPVHVTDLPGVEHGDVIDLTNGTPTGVET